MGCGGSKSAELKHLNEQQLQAMKKQEQIAMQQQQQMKLQAEALENARQQQDITAQQFEEQKALLLEQQNQLVKQQQEALQMALMAKKQAEIAANSAAEQALKKAEDMRRRITPPAKPGKLNTYAQTDRTIPPHAIMKRRKDTKKYKDAHGNVVETDGHKDHREECGGVGSDAVEPPPMAQVPVLIAKAKDPNYADEDEYEYQYEYQYQYQYNPGTGGPAAGPTAVVQAPNEPSPINVPTPQRMCQDSRSKKSSKSSKRSSAVPSVSSQQPKQKTPSVSIAPATEPSQQDNVIADLPSATNQPQATPETSSAVASVVASLVPEGSAIEAAPADKPDEYEYEYEYED